MSDRNLTAARLVEDHIDGIDIEGDAVGDLLVDFGVASKVERTAVVTSAKARRAGDARLYRQSSHRSRYGQHDARLWCTCPGFRFHELPSVEEIETDVEADLESIGRCKHGDEVAVADWTSKTARPDSKASRHSAIPIATRRTKSCQTQNHEP